MLQQGQIRHFTYYFRRMMKFHDLKVQGVPQVLFLLFLAVSFGTRLLLQPSTTEMFIYQQQLVNTYQDVLTNPSDFEALMRIPYTEEYMKMITLMFRVFGFFAIQQVLLLLLSFFYMGAYLTDMESPQSSLRLYMNKFLHALPRFIGFSFLFYLITGVLFVGLLILSSLVAMIVPVLYFFMVLPFIGWFFVQIIFIFREITFLDTGVGILKNFSLSWKLTAGNRLMIGRNIFFIIFLNIMTGMFTISSNVMLSLFIVSFLEVIVLLIRQRLTTLMYISRTRKEKDKTTKPDAN